MSVQYLTSILSLQSACIQRGVDLSVDFIGNESLVHRARNILAARFLKSQATHLLFIDADIGFNPETVFRLLDFDKDVVTAVYPKKFIDWKTVQTYLEKGSPSAERLEQVGVDFNINLRKTETAQNGFVPVLDSATGFMLIKRDLLQCMSDKYRDELYCVNDILGTSASVPDYVAVFDCMIDPENRRYLSEDFAFCRRVQQMGGEIWADIASPLGHIGNMLYEGDIRHRFQMTYVE
jgi:hypothetical protein